MMQPLIPMFADCKEGQAHVVLDCLIESLEDQLNEWAEKGYYIRSAPQVYQTFIREGSRDTYVRVMQILERDDERLKLEQKAAKKK